MTPFFGATVYDDPAIYQKSSAINFIKQAHTPTLVVVGGPGRGSAPRRSRMNFGTRCAASMCRRNWWFIPTRGMDLRTQSIGAMCWMRAVEWFGRYMPAEK